MPQLDVSWVVTDPMLADSFSVTRRQETIGATGRSTVTPTVFNNLVGVVTQGEPSTLQRADDSQQVPRVISIVTKFAARGAVTGYQPDLITWNGQDYLVTNCLPYNRFGAGFYEVIAASENAMDPPQ